MSDPQPPTDPAQRSVAKQGPPASATVSQMNASIETSQIVGAQSPAGNTKPTETPIPKAFGRYKIDKELGKGAMGIVYLAEDTQLGRKVALKIPKKAMLEDAEALERFYREAKTTATLRHNNICPVYDVGAIDGTHYLTMAYIPGKPVSNFLAKGKVPAAKQVALLIRKIALALDEAHRQGVVHRDLKPSNVMLDDRGEPIVMDFGLAFNTNTAKNARITQSGAILGTPAYMSPEQVTGEQDRIGPASDIYALGVMMYQLLTGELPFSGPIMLVLAQIMSHKPRTPSALKPDVDPALEAICLKMMAKEIGDRYASMKDAAAALTEYLKTGSVTGLEAVTASSPNNAPSLTAAPEVDFHALDFADGELGSSIRVARRKTKPKSKRIPPAYWIIGGATGGLGLVALLAVVLLFSGRNVTIQVTIDDPAAVVRVDSQQVTINSEGTGEVRLSLGEHTYIVERNGETIRGPEQFTITKNGTRALEITSIKVAGATNAAQSPAPEETPSRTTEVIEESKAALPAAQPPQPAVAPFDAMQAKVHQELWSKYLGVPVEYTNSIGMKFRLIPPGEFLMGAPESDTFAESVELPQHPVRLTRAYYLGTFEVTRRQFAEFVKATEFETEAEQNGRGGLTLDLNTGEPRQDRSVNWRTPGASGQPIQQDNHPVVCVSWNDVDAFCRWLSEQDQRKYRLPTEAEWENACRAGTTTRFHNSDEPNDLVKIANVADSDWQAQLANGNKVIQVSDGFVFTAPVGSFQPNSFGLFDTHGNVWEWCRDFHGNIYKPQLAIDPVGELNGARRATRGGGMDCWGKWCRASACDDVPPAGAVANLGFRVLLEIPDANTAGLKSSTTATPPQIESEPAVEMDRTLTSADIPPDSQLPVGERLDVLSMVRFPEHAFVGHWERQQKKVVCESSSPAILMIPVTISGSYELNCSFTRKTGTGSVFFVLPVGDHFCDLLISGWNGKLHGLQRIDGVWAETQYPTTGAVKFPGTIENGQRHHVRITVTQTADKAAIRAELNGTKFLDWTGNETQLVATPKERTPIHHGLGIGVWQSTAELHQLKLQLKENGVGYRLGNDWNNPLMTVSDQPPQSIEQRYLTWNDHKYYFSENPLTLPDAQQLADDLKGRLLTISSKAEEEFINKQAVGKSLWTAGWRSTGNPEWRDERNRPLRYFGTWYRGKPSNAEQDRYLMISTGAMHQGWYATWPGHAEKSRPPTGVHACIEWGREYPEAGAADTAADGAKNGPAEMSSRTKAAVKVKRGSKASAKKEQEGDFVPLFNGKDLTGWEIPPVNNANWIVQNGKLTCGWNSRPSFTAGILATQRKDYRDFHLRVTYLSAVNNQGIILRGAMQNDFFNGYRVSTALPNYSNVPMGSATKHSNWKLGTTHYFDYWKQAPKDNLVVPGEPYTFDMIAVGNRLQIMLNGKMVVDAVDQKAPYLSGRIILFCRFNTRFSSIEIKELNGE